MIDRLSMFTWSALTGSKAAGSQLRKGAPGERIPQSASRHIDATSLSSSSSRCARRGVAEQRRKAFEPELGALQEGGDEKSHEFQGKGLPLAGRRFETLVASGNPLGTSVVLSAEGIEAAPVRQCPCGALWVPCRALFVFAFFELRRATVTPPVVLRGDNSHPWGWGTCGVVGVKFLQVLYLQCVTERICVWLAGWSS